MDRPHYQLPRQFPLRTLAGEAADRVIGPTARRNVTITITDELPVVNCDWTRLLELLLNLLANAVKVMGNQPRPSAEIGVRPNGDTPIRFVRDNSQGIEPRHCERVFGLFENSDRSPRERGWGCTSFDVLAKCIGPRVGGIRRPRVEARTQMKKLLDCLLELPRVERAIHPTEEVLLADIVDCDACAIQLVLVSLIQNAQEAMKDSEPGQSVITIAAEKLAERTHQCERSWLGTLLVDTAGRLFEPYFITKPDGLGMGLKISQRIIQSHEDTLLAKANPDRGMTFQFTLRAAAERCIW